MATLRGLLQGHYGIDGISTAHAVHNGAKIESECTVVVLNLSQLSILYVFTFHEVQTRQKIQFVNLDF